MRFLYNALRLLFLIKTISLPYISNYHETLQLQVQKLIDENKLGAYLLRKYPTTHAYTNDKLLYEYVMEFKNNFFRKSEAISKVVYDGKISDVNDALGLHRLSIKNHGGRLRSKNEIRIASLFKSTPEPFLRMIVVHELSHLKEKEHNKAFYALCEKIEPSYHQLEFDMRLLLLHHELFGKLY